MKRRIPSSNALIMAESAARLGSFKKAGAELNVTASAVSHQMSALEAWLGFQLFVRETRSIVVTKSGERYLSRVAEILNELEAITALEMEKHSQSLNIRVQTTDSFANRWLVERLPHFLAEHAQLRVSIETFEYTEPFRPQSVDIAILFGTTTSLADNTHMILEEKIFPVCSSSISFHKTKSQTSKLRLLPLIEDNNLGVSWQQWCDLAVNEIGNFKCERVHFGAAYNHSHLAIRAAELGAGFALASLPLVQDALKEGILIAPFNTSVTTGKGYYISQPVSSRDHIQVFINWLNAQSGN